MGAVRAGAAGIDPVETAPAGLVAAKAGTTPGIRRPIITRPTDVAGVLAVIALRIFVVSAVKVAAIVAAAKVAAGPVAVAESTLLAFPPAHVAIAAALRFLVADPGPDPVAGPIHEAATVLLALRAEQGRGGKAGG